MNRRNDIPPEMRGLFLDNDTLERMLAGGIEPDDAPPGYAEVARILGAVALGSDSVTPRQEAEHVAAAQMLIARQSSASTRSDGRSKRMRSKGYRLKVAGLVALGTLAGTSGLAAAGVLPDSAQNIVSDVLDRVGISVPANEANEDPASSSEPIEPPSSLEGPGEDPASSGEAISEIATTTSSTGIDKGAEISSTASGGMSQAGEHGSVLDGADAAVVDSPNEGGSNTADTASGGNSAHGTAVADGASGGKSTAGSGNASAPPSGQPSAAGPPP
jgi:hypothetical protein